MINAKINSISIPPEFLSSKHKSSVYLTYKHLRRQPIPLTLSTEKREKEIKLPHTTPSLSTIYYVWIGYYCMECTLNNTPQKTNLCKKKIIL